MDLSEVYPDLDLKPYSHLLFSLGKNNINTAHLLGEEPKDIVQRCPLPLKDVQKLVKDVVQAAQRDLLETSKKRRKPLSDNADSTEGARKAKKMKSIATIAFVRTLDEKIDQALNGGIPPGHVTEIVGESAAGKTQLCLTLLLSVQLCLGKSAIYVSSEGPLNTSRLAQILAHQTIFDDLPPDKRPSFDRVYTKTVGDLEMQDHVLRYFVPVAIERFNVGLVVIDSVAANFRAEHGTNTPAQLAERAAELSNLGNLLRRIAIEHEVAIVVTNQVSDRFNDFRSQQHFSSPATTSSPAMSGTMPPAVAQYRQEKHSLDHQQLFFTGWGGDEKNSTRGEQMKTPALGLAWANQISARIVLKMESEEQEYAGGNIWKDKKRGRTLGLVFAPWAPPTNPPVRYEIAMQGLASISEPEVATQKSTELDSEHALLLDEALWSTDEEFP